MQCEHGCNGAHVEMASFDNFGSFGEKVIIMLIKSDEKFSELVRRVSHFWVVGTGCKGDQ